MNPIAETLVIETVVETRPIIDNCDEFQCVIEQDDPLSDPLSTNDTPEKDEFPSIDDDDSQTTDIEKDQTIRLVNVQELTDGNFEPSCNTKALPDKRPEPQPSCSKASEPNFEFDDLEDLIESSRIETSFSKKKVQDQPQPSTSSQLTVGDETWKLQELIDETSIASSVDSDITTNETPLVGERKAEFTDDEEKNLNDDLSSSSFLLEDFEDQITQNVVNKSNVSQSSPQIEQIESDDEPETAQMKDTKQEVEVTVISEDIEQKPEIETKQEEEKEKETKPEDILPEVDKISSEVLVKENESKPEKEGKVVVIEKPEVEIPEPSLEQKEVEQSESFQVTSETTYPANNEIVPDEVNLSCPPPVSCSSSTIVHTQEVEDSLAVIVEAVDLIQSTSAVSDPNKPIPTSSTAETTRDEEDGGLRSDGSDSGLGSEPSHNGSALLDKSLSATTTTKLPDPPAKGNLKRRSSEQIDTCNEIGTKRSKKGIQFEGVTVYSFPRQQGFNCVPSQGGCTLGMANQHCGVKYYTLTEHSAEQRRNHRQQLAEVNPRSSSSDDSDSEYEPTDSSSEADSEVYGFLQPVSARQRRALLKSAGVRKIDTTEKDECKMIRTSREVCGCTCRVYCDPDTCACSLAGIKCQVDRPNFPCGCTREGCGNVVGRVEFSPMRVRTHYIHTVMRLQMENKSERLRSSTNAASTASSNNYKAWQQQQTNVRQVPSSSSSSSSGNTCSVDGRAMVETQQQQQQHCDFSLIYDNHSSINTEIVPSAVTTNPASSSTAYSSYQSDTTSSYVNHIIDYVPKPSTSYATNANFDPNNAYMTSYVEPQSQQQQQQHQYLEVVSYDSMQTPTYQLHSYEHHSYAMPPQQINYTTYHHHPYPTSSPASSYIAYPNTTSKGYLQSHIQLCDQPMTTYNPNQTQIVSNTIMNATPSTSSTTMHQLYETAPSVVVQSNSNVLPVINGKQPFETVPGPTNPNTQQQQMVVTTNGNTNENLCEIIKKGIVETVSG